MFRLFTEYLCVPVRVRTIQFVSSTSRYFNNSESSSLARTEVREKSPRDDNPRNPSCERNSNYTGIELTRVSRSSCRAS